MFNRILRLVRQPINYVVLAGLLISSIIPVHAKPKKNGARERAWQLMRSAGRQFSPPSVGSMGRTFGQGLGYTAQAIVHSPQWVYHQLESGAKNFPKWGRRRIANGLKRFATPSAQEKVVISKWIMGRPKLTSEETALWRKFRNRALSRLGARAAIVTIILAILGTIAAEMYKRGKKKERLMIESAPSEKESEKKKEKPGDFEFEWLKKLVEKESKEEEGIGIKEQPKEEEWGIGFIPEDLSVRKKKKSKKRQEMEPTKEKKTWAEKRVQKEEEAKWQETRQEAIQQNPHLRFIANNLQSEIFMLMADKILKRYNDLSGAEKKFLNQIMDIKEKSRLDRIKMIAQASSTEKQRVQKLKEKEERVFLEEAP